jgi:hypothetical protein
MNKREILLGQSILPDYLPKLLLMLEIHFRALREPKSMP